MPLERVLLDTNVVIALFAGHPKVLEQLAAKQAVFLPVPALGELYRGAFGSARRADNLERLRRFAEQVAVLPCDVATAEHYGQVKQDLLQKGRPIPENDLWIAAVALQHGLAVMTRDAHFKEVTTIEVDFVDI
jgi:tRNA(fMet)-specific endonuclease VapC